jgi:molybdate transport system substrate-binding protein
LPTSPPSSAGIVEVGAVYRTDALSEKKVREVFAATGPDAPVIHYPIAIIKASKSALAAAKVRAFLLSDAARVIFAKYGFTIPDKPTSAPPTASAAKP